MTGDSRQDKVFVMSSSFAKHPTNVKLKKLVKQAIGPTQGEIAKLIGISDGHLSNILKGKRPAPEEYIDVLEKFLAKKVKS